LWVKSSFNGGYAKQGNNRSVQPLGSRLIHQGQIEYKINSNLKEKAGLQILMIGVSCLLTIVFSIVAVVMMKKGQAPSQEQAVTTNV